LLDYEGKKAVTIFDPFCLDLRYVEAACYAEPSRTRSGGRSCNDVHRVCPSQHLIRDSVVKQISDETFR